MEQLSLDFYWVFGHILFMALGLSLGLLGAGGALLAYPILTFFFKLTPFAATSYSFYVVNSVSLIGLILKRGNIHIKESLLFIIPSIVGVYFSRNFLFVRLPEVLLKTDFYTLYKSDVIETGMHLFMLIAGLALSIKKKNAISESDADISSSKKPLLFLILYSFLVGVITGIFGVGGGFLIIPVLVKLLHMGFKQATTTSLLIIFINTSAGISVDLFNGFFLDPFLLSKLIAIGLFGLFIGNYFSKKMKTTTLQKALSFVMIIVGGGFLLNGFLNFFFWGV